MIGFYSYSIYLIHTVALANLNVWWHAAGLGGRPLIIMALVAGALCPACAMAVYYFAEHPVKRWRARLISSTS
ncbi:hypothetical protein [Pseudoruegeria sp. SK021]|uniref:hypothetical protein n=1 Tax=Pseudoruegeria sp. SK021 TaxID=1933035 RepID=UPI000A31F6AB|nr:hypothetical protein [Pseudoruegeria sp. SK021]